MDWKTFAVELVGILAWPVTILIVARIAAKAFRDWPEED